jgi:hypothetical protein
MPPVEAFIDAGCDEGVSNGKDDEDEDEDGEAFEGEGSLDPSEERRGEIDLDGLAMFD